MGKIVRVAILSAGLSPRERDRLYLLSSVSSPFHVSAPCLRGRPARGQGRAERDENVSVHCDPLLFVGVRGGLRLEMVHGKSRGYEECPTCQRAFLAGGRGVRIPPGAPLLDGYLRDTPGSVAIGRARLVGTSFLSAPRETPVPT